MFLQLREFFWCSFPISALDLTLLCSYLLFVLSQKSPCFSGFPQSDDIMPPAVQSCPALVLWSLQTTRGPTLDVPLCGTGIISWTLHVRGLNFLSYQGNSQKHSGLWKICNTWRSQHRLCRPAHWAALATCPAVCYEDKDSPDWMPYLCVQLSGNIQELLPFIHH